MPTQIHSWETMGGNSQTWITLPVGSYELRSTVSDPSIAVLIAGGGIPILQGAGSFTIAAADKFVVVYGNLPKSLSLWGLP
jgi:hypothetical protein